MRFLENLEKRIDVMVRRLLMSCRIPESIYCPYNSIQSPGCKAAAGSAGFPGIPLSGSERCAADRRAPAHPVFSAGAAPQAGRIPPDSVFQTGRERSVQESGTARQYG